MKYYGFIRMVILSTALMAAGCTVISSGPAVAGVGSPSLAILDRLYCGRTIPSGGKVSDEAWAQFLAEVVTPRFPDGLTVLSGDGQWREPSGTVTRERCFILELNHADTAAAEQSVLAIIIEYKRRFRQEAVLRIRTHADATLL
jgi:hypothetical protein